MGHIVETYSLSELKKISIPGKVVPSIFWAIPVGRWDYSNLEQFWKFFTNSRKSYCEKFGLLLVKDMRGRTTTNSPKTDLKDISAKLEDIIPGGNITSYQYINNNKKVLLLSGSYPQPGWGVLIEINDYQELEYTIRKAIDNTFNEREDLKKYEQCSEKYYTWSTCENNRPMPPNFSSIDNELQLTKSYILEFTEFLKQDRDKYLNKNSIYKIKNLINEKPNSNIKKLITDFLESINNIFLLALEIHSNAINIDNTILNSKIKDFVNKHNDYDNNFYKTEKSEPIKRLFANIKKLDNNHMPKDDFCEWAEQIYTNQIEQILQIAYSSKTQLEASITQLENSKILLASEHQDIYKKWREEKERLRKEFELSLKEILLIQQNSSANFLINLELETKHMNKEIVYWDAARMIGWKLHELLNSKITKYDFVHKIKELYGIESTYDDDEALINGSLFTDYIHYIIKSEPHKDIRDVAKMLITSLLKPSEIRDIINIYRIDSSNESSVEELLNIFGWKANLEKKIVPLAACINTIHGTININSKFDGNELRIVLENYTKDFLYTLINITGLDNEKLWEIVLHKKHDYNKKCTFLINEIKDITLGNGKYIIEALLEFIFHDKLNDVKDYIDNYNKLTKLNKLSHDSEEKIAIDNFALPINELLRLTKIFIQEMPWHFTQVQQNGNYPIVITGNAWSHSYKEERQLSFILWDQNPSELSKKLLIWNPTRINPVMPDAIIIRNL